MDPDKVLKVSVTAEGDLTLDGNSVTLAELAAAFEVGAKEKTAVWYHRGHAESEPPPVAMEVMKLIVANRLPVRLSTQADFSDTVAPDLDQVFRPLREKAAQGNLAILRPDGNQLVLPALKKEAMPPEAVTQVERMVPSAVRRFIAVVGDTSWTMAPAPDLHAANAAIPFFGLLMGFSSLGHVVWIFDAKALPVLAAGCSQAELLILTSDRLEQLPDPWQESVTKSMRSPQIMVFDRTTAQFRKP